MDHNHTNLNFTAEAVSDDDRESLVPQPDASKPQSAFQIITTTTSHLTTNLNLRRHHHLLICILLPISILLLAFLFLSHDFSRLFHTIPSLNLPTPTPSLTSDRMRDSELHALSLLRTQRLSLMRLLNQSSNNYSISTFSNDFKSALFEQIRINGNIQKALLSSHAFADYNCTEHCDEIDNVGSLPPDHTCLRVDSPSANRRTVDWNLKEDRFLFAICVSGQMSNHLICLEKHMLFAALLGRILVLPSSKIDYQYDRVLDVGHVNDCLDKKVVVSFEEFAEMRKKKKKEVGVDGFVCYMAEPPCFLDEEHIKKLKGLGLSMGKIKAAWPEDAKLKEQKKRTVADVMPKFSTEDEVLAIGDMFYADFEKEWLMQSGGPIAHKCKALIQPSKLIMLTAQRFVQTFLGSNFIALHFRRHGFLKFCNAKKESCFFPIPQAAECILRVVGKANAPVIYLSTDAADSETNLLQSLVAFDYKQIPLVKRPEHNAAEKWDALLYRNHIDGDSQVEAMLDKTICALSNVFIGSSGSTFTEDILRLRRGWGSASQCDEYLCRGEQPNYIAGQE